jgi:hypothetical protein
MKSVLSFCLATSLFLLVGCTSDSSDPAGQGRVMMYMTDSPGSFEAVNIVVARVEVHMSGSGWVTINDSLRTYDLLTLRNGAITVIGDAMVNAGHYTQIRLVLGAGSTVVVNGQTFSLNVPSNEIYLVHQFRIEAGTTYELLLDFDAARSVVYAGGSYQLQPTIRVNAVALTGSIAGVVQPPQAAAMVTVISEGDTAITYAEASGMFRLMCLPPASYVVRIQATQGPFRDTTITGAEVSAQQTTDLGVILLRP